MSMGKQVRLGGLGGLALALSVAAALAVGQFGAGTVSAQEPPMEGTVAVDCDASTPALDTACQYDFGATFQVGFYVVEPPADGYYGLQSKLDWDNAVVMWQPAASAEDEGVWEPCTIAARDPEPDAGEGSDPPMVFFCTPLPGLTTGDTATGNAFVWEFQCMMEPPGGVSPPGSLPSSDLTLLEPGDPGGTWLQDAFINRITPAIDPPASSVACGPLPEEPTPTEGPPGATPTGEEGEAGVTPTIGALPESGVGVTSSSGSGIGLWASLGALVALAATGLGVYGWRSARSR